MPENDDLNIGRSAGRMSSTGRKLETQLSREVYREKRLSDSRLKAIRLAAYKLIYNLSPDEKISLIRSYGDFSQLPSNASIETINEQLVESMIINLSAAELNGLVSKQRRKEHEFMSTINTAIDSTTTAANSAKNTISSRGRERVRASSSSNISNTLNPNNVSAGGSGAAKIAANHMEGTDFLATKYSSSMSTTARREAYDYLDGMSPIQVGMIARKLGINYIGLSPKEVKEKIMNYVALYVAAITGKAKVIPPIDTEGVNTINDILKYTSLAYLSGISGRISPKALAAMKKAAKVNKAMASERATIGNMINASTTSKYFKKIAGKTGRGKALDAALEFNDTGVLANKSLDELTAMAVNLGIDVDSEKMTIGTIKKLIYQKLASNLKRQEKIKNQLARAKLEDFEARSKGKPGKSRLIGELEAQLNANIALTTKQDGGSSGKFAIGSKMSNSTKLSESLTGAGSAAIPVIKFKDGNALVDEIDMAVPVWVIGQGKTPIEAKSDEVKTGKLFAGATVSDLIKTAQELGMDTSKISEMSRKKLIAEIKKAAKKRDKAIDKDKSTLKEKGLQKAKDKAFKELERAYKQKEKELFKTKIGNAAEADAYAKQLSLKYKLAAEKINNATSNEAAKSITLETLTDIDISKYTNETNKNNSSNDNEKGLKVLSNVQITPGGMIENALYNATPVAIVASYASQSASTPTAAPDGPDGLKAMIANLGSRSKKLSDKINSWNEGLSDTGNDLSASDVSGYMNSAAKKLFNNTMTTNSIQPVWITNGFTEYLTNITEKGLQNLQSSTSAIYNYLSTSMPVLFAGLQQAGTSFNLAGAGAAAATALEAVAGAAELTFDAMESVTAGANVPRFATGGTARASSAVSQFIAGDSLTGKPNEELVSIDWNRKQVQTTPTNSTQPAGNLTNITRMNSVERKAPMNVALASAMVKFKSDYLSDVENYDDYALKVYPVTPSITDKVNVNGTEISLMDAIVGMYGTLTSIESLVGTVAQTSAANLAKPTQNVISSGGESMSSPISASDSSIGQILRGD